MATSIEPEIIGYCNGSEYTGVCNYTMPNGMSFSKYIEEKQYAKEKRLSTGYFSDTFLIEESGIPKFVFKLYYNKYANRTYYKELAIREMKALIAVRNNPYATKLIAAQIEPTRACFLLSYVPGVTLAEWLRKHPTLEEREDIISHIKAGIASIHEDNIVHSDIKEDNIWVPNPDQVSNSVKEIIFLDFGLASPPNKDIRVEGTTAMLSSSISPSSMRGATYTTDVNHQLIAKLEDRILNSGSSRYSRSISPSNINLQKPYGELNMSNTMEENPKKPYGALNMSNTMEANPKKPYAALNMSGGGSRGKGMHIKLLLIRHSKSCANLIREHGSRVRHTRKRRAIMLASQKVRDPGLTKIGQRMAESYGAALRAKAEAAGFDLETATIGSSALRRAKETAALLFPTVAASNKLVVFPHLTEHGRIPENTPKRHAHTRPDWNAFLRHLRVDRATSEQAAAQFIVVGHGSYLREVWRELTGKPWATFHNLDAFVIEGDLDVRGRLTVEQAERMPYTGRVSTKGTGDQCMLAQQTRKIKRKDR